MSEPRETWNLARSELSRPGPRTKEDKEIHIVVRSKFCQVRFSIATAVSVFATSAQAYLAIRCRSLFGTPFVGTVCSACRGTSSRLP